LYLFFVGTSVDGFIARPNGTFDFLPAGGGEPHGYAEFMASVDALVIGRNTFETVRGFKPWPYDKKRVVVLSSKPVDLSAVRGGIVEQLAGKPAEIVAKLAACGAHHLYVDGGITIQRFLRGAGSTIDYHPCSGANWRRNPALRQFAARSATPPHNDATVPERPGQERVPSRDLVPQIQPQSAAPLNTTMCCALSTVNGGHHRRDDSHIWRLAFAQHLVGGLRFHIEREATALRNAAKTEELQKG
jgi:dihydrofolate reductase